MAYLLLIGAAWHNVSIQFSDLMDLSASGVEKEGHLFALLAHKIWKYKWLVKAEPQEIFVLNTSLTNCKYVLVIPEGSLGKLEITVVFGTGTVIVTIFHVLFRFYVNGCPIAHWPHGFANLAWPRPIEQLVLFLMSTRHALIQQGGECDVIAPPLHLFHLENTIY